MGSNCSATIKDGELSFNVDMTADQLLYLQSKRKQMTNDKRRELDEVITKKVLQNIVNDKCQIEKDCPQP